MELAHQISHSSYISSRPKSGDVPILFVICLPLHVDSPFKGTMAVGQLSVFGSTCDFQIGSDGRAKRPRSECTPPTTTASAFYRPFFSRYEIFPELLPAAAQWYAK